MNTRQQAARRWFLETALAYLGTPYVWGGDDPSGYDCSGLVIESLRSAGLIENVDLSADGLLQRFKVFEIGHGGEGCLVFLLDGQGKAVHVGICLDSWFMIEAGGGDDRVKNDVDAWERNAFVKVRPLPPSGPRRRICDPLLSIKD